MMNPDVLMLFGQAPVALNLYTQLETRILDTFDDVTLRVGKTQVGFFNTHGFAWLWPPHRKVKGWPDLYLGVTFGLDHRLEHPRIAEAVEPYPNRWTHHVIVQDESEIDSHLMGWIGESYQFSLSKRRGKNGQAV